MTGSREGLLLDLEHLRTVTFGDREFALDVLGLFLQQLAVLKEQLGDHEKPQVEKEAVLHRMRGAALGVGAVPLADAARKAQEHGAYVALDRVLVETLQLCQAMLSGDEILY
ncbi:hypothetical protein [Polycladidibacter hongkongensis]|uniref:hypothetical protein n=1 Tax=Polycladidibacter hongkongensis TaxID=1647556 RepID=UPI0008317141|nr:hypothetical protein [Pseudovibrio hongkongensis]